MSGSQEEHVLLKGETGNQGDENLKEDILKWWDVERDLVPKWVKT